MPRSTSTILTKVVIQYKQSHLIVNTARQSHGVKQGTSKTAIISHCCHYLYNREHFAHLQLLPLTITLLCFHRWLFPLHTAISADIAHLWPLRTCAI